MYCIAGNRQSGKSWLLNRLEKRETSGRGSALEYHFLNVHTDYRDVSYAYQLASAGTSITYNLIVFTEWKFLLRQLSVG